MPFVSSTAAAVELAEVEVDVALLVITAGLLLVALDTLVGTDDDDDDDEAEGGVALALPATDAWLASLPAADSVSSVRVALSAVVTHFEERAAGVGDSGGVGTETGSPLVNVEMSLTASTGDKGADVCVFESTVEGLAVPLTTSDIRFSKVSPSTEVPSDGVAVPGSGGKDEASKSNFGDKGFTSLLEALAFIESGRPLAFALSSSRRLRLCRLLCGCWADGIVWASGC